ncbi:MAG TPA: hypothetical protein VFL57_08495 [Bryobacteraceae bacterium]|nr:hypothetical protein [Bryobacteraceae bacterium]
MTRILSLLAGGAMLAGATPPPSDIRVLGVTSTQAVVAYAAPVPQPCTIAVSEGDVVSRLVHDVNPALFSGADRDDRAGSIITGRNRIVVIGKRAAETASDGRRYSRALKAYTRHTLRITCGADGVSPPVSFRTANIATGNSYYDVPFDRARPGEYAFPTIDFLDKTKAYVDPFTGVELRRFSGPREIAPYTDQKTFSAIYDLGSGWTGATNSYNGAAITSRAPGVWAYFRSGDPLAYPYAQLDFVQMKFTARAVGAPQDIEVCVTIDGKTCASRIARVSLGTSSTTYTVGDQVPVVEFWRSGVPSLPFRMQDVRKTTGTLAKAGAVLTWTGGADLFNVNWRDASQITLGSTECRIASVTSDKQIAVADPACAEDGNHSWSAVNFGFLVRRAATGTAEVTISNAAWVLGSSALVYGSSSGAFDVCQPIEVQGPTGPGYYCTAVSTAMQYGGGTPLYWVGVDGTVNPLGLLIETLPEVAGNAPCFGLSTAWDSTVPGKLWCIGAGVSGDQVIYTGTWVGPKTPQPIPAIETPVGLPNMRWTLEAQGLKAMVTAFDDRYRSFQSSTDWILIGRSKDNLIFSQYQLYQDSVAWLAVWNTKSKTIIAATATYNGDAMAANRWMVDHAVFPAGDIPAFMVHSNAGILPYQATIESGTLGEAPWEACPANNVDPGLSGKAECTTVVVSSTTPANPADGSTLFGQSWLIGDYAVVMREAGSGWAQDGEQVRILAIDGNALTLQRWPTPRRSFGAKFAHTGRLALAAVGSAWSQFWWNYEADPHGIGIRTPYGNTVMDDPQAHDCHQVYMTGVYLVGCVKFAYFNGTVIKTGSYPEFLTQADSDIRLSGYLNQKFAGQLPRVSGFEAHPSRQHYNAPPSEIPVSLDNSPYHGSSVYQPFLSKVNGTEFIYRFAAEGAVDFDDKRLPLVVTSGPWVLVDVSPQRLTDSASDHYRYCRARSAGECWPDSRPGDLYANIPFASQPNCYPTRFAPNMETRDFCVTNGMSALQRFVQFSSVRNDPEGNLTRALTSGFSPYKTESIYWNSRYIPDGSAAFFVVQNLNLARPEVMLVKLPPFPPDEQINRTSFIPVTVEFEVPKGRHITNVVADFGYAENGPSGSFFCTGRQEPCIAAAASVNETNPFYFASDGAGRVESGIEGLPCTTKCSIAIPAISGRVLYYRVRYRNAENATVDSEPLRVVIVP